MIVRKAVVQDEEELMGMCRDLHKENGVFTMNEDKVRSALKRAFEHRGAIVGVIRNPKEIEASIYLMFATHWYSDQWHLSEMWNYVRPSYRKTNDAKELIGFARKCSEEVSLPLVIGVVSNKRTEAKIKLYERQLSAKPAGCFFLHLPKVA